jgi:hypothetical protein
MQKILITLLLAALVCPVLAGSQLSLSLDGNVTGTFFNTDYNLGITPAYHRLIVDSREFMIAIPIHYWGVYAGTGGNNSTRTTYTTLGFDLGYYWKVFGVNRLKVSFGPEFYVSYALPPTTVTSINGSTTTSKDNAYVIGSVGLCAPVNVDLFMNDHIGLRLSDRLLRATLDVLLDNSLADRNRFGFNAGLNPVIQPSIGLLYRF